MHRSGNRKVRKRIRNSDQEVPLSGTESEEDPHPLDGTRYVQESKSSHPVAGDALSASLKSLNSSGSTHPKCQQKKEKTIIFFLTFYHVLGFFFFFTSLYLIVSFLRISKIRYTKVK